MLRRRAAASRTGTPADLLVVGLGNPGAEYEHTRHNAGADTVALLAERHGGRLRAGKELAWSCEVRIGGRLVALARPQTYMNESGMAVAKLVRRHGVAEEPTRLLVVHDELDLPLGRLQVKAGGGLAGNNGLASIKQHLKTTDFLRIRIGIGKPPGRKQGADHVLSRPSARERTELDVVLQEAADAAEMIVTEGVAAAQNRYNTPPEARNTPDAPTR